MRPLLVDDADRSGASERRSCRGTNADGPGCSRTHGGRATDLTWAAAHVGPPARAAAARTRCSSSRPTPIVDSRPRTLARSLSLDPTRPDPRPAKARCMSPTSTLTAGRLLSRLRPPTLAPHHLARSSSWTRLQPTASSASFTVLPSSRRHASSTSTATGALAGRRLASTPPVRSKPPNARRGVSSAASSEPSAAAAASSPSSPPAAGDSWQVASREPPPSRELEVQDQVLFAIAEQVGGKFGNAVKYVAPSARARAGRVRRRARAGPSQPFHLAPSS